MAATLATSHCVSIDFAISARHGVKSFPEIEYHWLVVNAVLDDSTLQDILIDKFPESYGGPGSYFANPPSIRRSRSRTLIVQRCGFDV